MVSIVNNLFPPIINTYMPSFDINETTPLTQEEIELGRVKEIKHCRVYFSLSDFNNIEDISKKDVHVTVNDRNTNRSVLKLEKYPGEIKITELKEDISIKDKFRYYIEIEQDDLVEGFKTNRYYKVQIRFSLSTVKSFEDSGKGISVWLNENQDSFSEWSSVCLVRGIETPIVSIRGFEDISNNRETVVTTESIQITGNVSFINPTGEPTEFLDRASVKIYKEDEEEDSVKAHNIQIQQNISGSKSEFNYIVQDFLEEDCVYRIKFSYTTNGGYTGSKTFSFRMLNYKVETLSVDINAEPDNEEGRVKITLKSTQAEDFVGKITIRRTSSESDFKVWEDVHNIVFSDKALNEYIWYDYTIKSGVWYKYCAQKRLGYNGRGDIILIEEPIMVYFEDMFLVSGDRQLKLKYDPSISSFKYNVFESKTDTLGSIYPFINRNGATKYRTLPISGLITSFCDEKGLFTSKTDIYGNNLILYEKYNDINDIHKYKDFSYEREFRERVIDFLYEDNVKLLKSPTEGNILVKIMELNFTPNQTLGRMLYSFSATTHEIDEFNFDNCKKYNIQTFLPLDENLIQKKDIVFGKIVLTSGQVPDTDEEGKSVLRNALFLQDSFMDNGVNEQEVPADNIIGIINDKNQFNKEAGFNSMIENLTSASLLFTGKPSLLKIVNDNISIVTSLKDEIKNLEEAEEESAFISGYWIRINDEDVIIKASPLQDYQGKKYYATKYDISGLGVETLEICSPSDVEISYETERVQEENIAKMVSRLYYEKKIGQIEKVFKPNKTIMKDLHIKYTEDFDTGYTEMLSLLGFSIEAPQGTIVFVKDSKDTKYNQHDVSALGFLDLENIYATIDDFYIGGIRLDPAPFRENDMELNKNKTEFINEYPSFYENQSNVIRKTEYLNMYTTYEEKDGFIETGIKLGLPNHPFMNGVYAKEEEDTINYYVYYNSKWYPFDILEEKVICPVPALINYCCEVVEGEY